MNKRHVVLAAAASCTVLVALGYGGYVGWSKVADLRQRFQLVEERANSYGQLLAAEHIRYQATRGPARFTAVDSTDEIERGAWTKITGDGENGSWDRRDFIKSKALAVHGDRLYVGLCSVKRGNAQIWRFDGTRWEAVWKADDGRGLTCVNVLASDGKTLYAGIDNTVWRQDDAKGWHQIGGPGIAGTWAAGAYDSAYSMEFYRGALVVGTTKPASVLAYADGQWRDTTKDVPAFGERYIGVYELKTHSDGRLYAGMAAPWGTNAAVFRYDGANWDQIGGDGIRGSWRSLGSTYALSMASYQGRLVVATNRHPMVSADFSSIWAYSGEEWHPVGLGHIPAVWGQMHNYNAMIVFNDVLIVGGGGHPGGNASAWLIKTGPAVKPVKIGGHGKNGSWGMGRDGRLSSAPHAPSEYVYRFAVWRGTLIAGFGMDAGTAQVWQYRPAGAKEETRATDSR